VAYHEGSKDNYSYRVKLVNRSKKTKPPAKMPVYIMLMWQHYAEITIVASIICSLNHNHLLLY